MVAYLSDQLSLRRAKQKRKQHFDYRYNKTAPQKHSRRAADDFYECYDIRYLFFISSQLPSGITTLVVYTSSRIRRPAASAHQSVSLFDNPAAVKIYDLIGELSDAETVGDNYNALTAVKQIVGYEFISSASRIEAPEAGSSNTLQSLFPNSHLAIAILCHCPPDNSMPSGSYSPVQSVLSSPFLEPFGVKS